MIDFHTHIFPDAVAEKCLPHLAEVCRTSPFTDAKMQGLLSSANAAQLECAVVLPVVTAPKQFESIHRFAMQFLEGTLLSFGGIHPENEDYKAKLNWIKDQGFKGIKLHPDYQGTYFTDMRYKRIIAYASELNLIVVTHTGVDPLCPNDIHCTPKMIAEVLDEVKPTKLVLAHMGGNWMADEAEQYLVGRDVYFDTAYVLDKMKEEQLLRMIRSHGANKILFASDSPWAGQKEYVNLMQSLPLTEEEKNLILRENAKHLLNL